MLILQRIFLSLLLITAASSKELIFGVEKCHFGDEKCLIAAANKLIRLYPKGSAKYRIHAFDEIKIPDFSLLRAPGPVSVDYRLKDQVLKGFENATITRMKGFLRDPTSSRLEIALRIPRLLQQGSFEFMGRGLLVYSNSSGKSSSDLQNVRINLKLKVIMEYRHNKRYVNLYEVAPVIELDRWILSVDNLYKENSDLTETLNRVFNENWLEFWNELEPSLVPKYVDGIKDAFTRILRRTAYDDLFLP